MIYCSRQIQKENTINTWNLTFQSLKSYSADFYKKTLQKVLIPYYDNFFNLDVTYGDLISKPKSAINIEASINVIRIKSNTRKWFDRETTEKIHTKDK